MIIGVTGGFSAGKDTVVDYLIKKGFQSASLSDIIREELTKEGKELSRKNLQDKGDLLRKKFGPGYLAEKALERLNPEDPIVINSVRQTGEVKELKESGHFQLWSIDAPVEVRYKRMIDRARTEDEKNLTLEDFIQREEREKAKDETSLQLDKVIEMADIKIVNDGTIPELYKKVEFQLEEINA